jgi:hypothetical protein
MLRGQTAPLSPNEEITLRRIALGVVPTGDLLPRDVARLVLLALIERDGERLRLTPLGQMRYEALPRASRMDDSRHEPALAFTPSSVASDIPSATTTGIARNRPRR